MDRRHRRRRVAAVSGDRMTTRPDTWPEQLELIRSVAGNPQPWAVDDLEHIHAAWIADDALHGHVSPNCVRRMLTNKAGILTVDSRRLSSSYSSSLLRRVGWVESTDVRGGNVGKRIGLYEWVAAA